MSYSLPQHTPSQSVTDEEGNKWRLCAGAAVFNSKNELLIGERLGKPGSWQTPQGGVDGGDKPETVSQAAIRELFEEVGLKHGQHGVIDEVAATLGATDVKCRYKTEGTGSWLEKEGFSGQELNWVIFRCADPDLERNPSLICNLSGQGGEKPEFTAVRWESLDWVVENVWDKKVRPYQVLRDACTPMLKQWEENCGKLKFSGKWSRDATRCVGVAEALVVRGLVEEEAAEKAAAPYIQSFKRSSNPREWLITTYDKEGIKPRRELLYPLGKFTEGYDGASTLFGGTDGGVVQRCCFYLAEDDADDQIAHVTVSETPRGKEESIRYIKNGELILRRKFLHSLSCRKVVSTEVFTRC